VDTLFLVVAVSLAVGMMVLMIKYASFIHKQPRIEAERRQNMDKENIPPTDPT
jgi:hypothetical protein